MDMICMMIIEISMEIIVFIGVKEIQQVAHHFGQWAIDMKITRIQD